MRSPAEEPWSDNPVLLAGGEVIVAPRDAAALLGFARDTGEELRRLAVRGSPRLPHVLGIRRGVLYRAGAERIEGYALSGAGFKPQIVCRPGKRIVGRPALTDAGLYFCMADGPGGGRGGLHWYDFETRAVNAVATWPAAQDKRHLGNVCVTDRAVLVASDLCITAYVGAAGGAP
jgi:hypothetical protein